MQRRNFERSAIGYGTRPGHGRSQLHITCLQAREEQRSNSTMEAAIDKISVRERETMENLFRVLHHIGKRTKPLAESEHIVHLLDERGAGVCDKEHSRLAFA